MLVCGVFLKIDPIRESSSLEKSIFYLQICIEKGFIGVHICKYYACFSFTFLLKMFSSFDFSMLFFSNLDPFMLESFTS